LHPQLSKHAWQKYKCKFCTPATFRRTNVIELPNGINHRPGNARPHFRRLFRHQLAVMLKNGVRCEGKG
jgi:hypothetical protein